VIGLISGTVSAAARSAGHLISFFITLTLMVVVGFYLYSATQGQRYYLPFRQKYGPFMVLCVAAPLIMADLVRHLLQDNNVWLECGNNPTFSRINSSESFPDSCFWSSSQYHCEEKCCVPTWMADPEKPSTYKWFPDQSIFFPNDTTAVQFGTLRSDGTVYFPPGFDLSKPPFTLFTAPLVLYDDFTINPINFTANLLANGSFPGISCKYGVNPLTGYCLMPEVETCDCDHCLPDAHENMAHLSPMGWLFTIGFTYSGFVLLAVAVMWNANIVHKLKGLKTKWRQLRAQVNAQP